MDFLLISENSSGIGRGSAMVYILVESDGECRAQMPGMKHNPDNTRDKFHQNPTAGMNARVKALTDMSKLSQSFSIYSTVKDAEAALGQMVD